MTKLLPLVRATPFNLFVNFLEENDIPTETLLKQSKLPIYVLDDDNSFLSCYQAFNFVDMIAHRQGIDNFGLLVAQNKGIDSMGILGRLTSQCLTLYDAILTGIYVGNLYNSCEHFWLIEKGENAYFCQEFISSQELILDHICHFSLMMMINLIQKVAGKNWYPKKISLQRHFPIINHPLKDAEINLDVTINSIAFPRSFLSLPLPSVSYHPSPTEDYLNLYKTTPSHQFSHRLMSAIAPYLKEGYPTLKIASEISNLSPRTLQRRLWEEGLTYEKLIEGIRYNLAIIMLKDPTMKIIDIAYELGYKEPSHFTRAFKRWTGKSPNSYRHC